MRRRGVVRSFFRTSSIAGVVFQPTSGCFRRFPSPKEQIVFVADSYLLKIDRNIPDDKKIPRQLFWGVPR